MKNPPLAFLLALLESCPIFYFFILIFFFVAFAFGIFLVGENVGPS